MKRMFGQVGVIARRDFLAIVGTPTFLLFLLAPLMMIGFGVVGGTGAAQMGASSAEKLRIVAIMDASDAARLRAADTSLRPLYAPGEGPPALQIVAPAGDIARQQAALFTDDKADVTAIMSGPVAKPAIAYHAPSVRHARYLAALAEAVVREARTGIRVDQAISAPMLKEVTRTAKSGPGGQAGAGFAAVFGIFFLTLLLAGQAVSTLTEEKSNKVIEILAAAVPLEAVFLGKLIGMLGVALVFVAFWGVLGMVGLSLIPGGGVGQFAPAIGLPLFLILCGLYFTMAYMLLGAVFLGIGAQASTMREIQMLSLPITIFQVSMFGLASAAAGSPGSTIARFAEIFPFSSPFAMAARGASDAALWPHVLALGWQALWVALTIWVSVRLFRIGVLKSGGGLRAALFGRLAKQ